MGLRGRHSNCLSDLLKIQNGAGNTEERIYWSKVKWRFRQIQWPYQKTRTLKSKCFTSFSSLMRFLKAYLQPHLYFSSCVTIRLQSNMHLKYCWKPKRVGLKLHNKCTFQRHYQSDNICFSDCIHLQCGNTGYGFSSSRIQN